MYSKLFFKNNLKSSFKSVFIACLTLTIFGLTSCEDDSLLPNSTTNHLKVASEISDSDVEVYDIPDYDIKSIHDAYCEELLDSIDVWIQYDYTDEELYQLVYDVFLVEKMSVTLNMSEDQVTDALNDIGMTPSNCHDFPDIIIVEFDDITLQYLNSLEDLMSYGYDNLSEDELHFELDQFKTEWYDVIDPLIVDSSVEVAKSSVIIWRDNVDDLIGYTAARGNIDPCDPKKMGKSVGTADVTSGIWGGLVGSILPGAGTLAGAMLGAVGGSLGRAIGLVIEGC